MLVDSFDAVLQNFRVSKEYGFLLECDLSMMPETFKPWVDLCGQAKNLIKVGRLHEEVLTLPELNIAELESYESQRLAHLLLITIASGYLWCNGKDDAPKSLPRAVAKPLFDVAEKLGMRPVVSHASTCLCNWNIIDSSKPFSPENLRLNAFELAPGYGNVWFFTVTAQIEKDFAEAIYAITKASWQNSTSTVNKTTVNDASDSITKSCRNALETLKRMSEHLTPREFYHEVRPFLWGYNEGDLKRDGLIFEGVDTEPLRHGGATAAQSSTLQLMDAFLGITHAGESGEFLNEQLHHMPREHRELIQYVRKNTPLTAIEEDGSTNEAKEAVKNFRSYHIRIVTQYIISQLKSDSEAIGTGGSSVMQFLKTVRDESS